MELPESYGAERNIALSDLTSFRVGGPACVVLHPRSYDAIADIVSAARRHSVPLALLGKGTNVLASDRGYDGWIIRFDTPLHDPVYRGTDVTVCCGMSMTVLARETVRKGLMSMECLCGIPGTVGGACAMNAGAYGSEIKQILKRIRRIEAPQGLVCLFQFPTCRRCLFLQCIETLTAVLQRLFRLFQIHCHCFILLFIISEFIWGFAPVYPKMFRRAALQASISSTASML